jgi:hypothetical protein
VGLMLALPTLNTSNSVVMMSGSTSSDLLTTFKKDCREGEHILIFFSFYLPVCTWLNVECIKMVTCYVNAWYSTKKEGDL